MAKKKKTQLKPVARGFATVSVAKKVVPTEPEPEAAPDPVEGPSSSELQGPSSKPDVQGANDEFDPDKAEEQSLQNLVDKYQDRVEKEVVRTLKVWRPSLRSPRYGENSPRTCGGSDSRDELPESRLLCDRGQIHR